MLIDTHFHLDLMENMHSLIRELNNADVGVLAVGTTPKAYEREKKFCEGVDGIKVGLGFHPQLVAERSPELDLFLRLIKTSKFIGEIGLDFNKGYIASKEEQLSCLRKIAKACTDEGNKVLSIHSLKAVGAVIDELEKAETFHNNICIFHWFTGTAVERRRAIDAGAWFSINPKMLKTKSGQETVKAIPSDRMLLETDAPFTIKIESVNILKKELNDLSSCVSGTRNEDVSHIIEDNSMRIWYGSIA